MGAFPEDLICLGKRTGSLDRSPSDVAQQGTAPVDRQAASLGLSGCTLG